MGVEDLPGNRGEKLYVYASVLLHEIALNAASGVSRWGEFNLPSPVSEQAEAHDLSLDLAARKFNTINVSHCDHAGAGSRGRASEKKTDEDQCQGSISVTPQPSKSRILRVANAAPRERATPAIIASGMATGRPCTRRAAANFACASAASPS